MKRFVFLLCSCFSFCIAAQAQEKLADSLISIGDYKGAMDIYNAAVPSAPIYFKTGSAYAALGNFPKSIADYEKGLELDPAAVKPRFELGKLYLGALDVVKGLMIFTQLNKEYPENATYLFYKGQGFELLKSEKTAMDVYENVLKLDPEYRRARVELVPLLIKNRETAIAISYAEQVLDENPDDIKFNSLIAQAYFNAKNYGKAIEHIERLFTLGNDTEYNRRTLALSYYEDTQWEKAIENFDIFLVQYDEKDPIIYFLKSKSHYRLEQYDEAQDAIESAIAFKRPNITQEYLQLASVHAGRQDDKAVFNTLLAAQKEYPEDRIIAYQLAVAADKYFKDKAAVLRYYEKFLDKFGNTDGYGEYVTSRASEIKTELFLNKKE